MNCYLSGIIGLGMVGATFATMSTSEEENHRLREVLPPKLDEIYHRIVIERRNLYLQGLLLGFIIAFFSIKFFKTSGTFHKIALFLAITLPISVFYYLMMPKSDYMLNHLQTEEENKAWLEVYKNMKQKYIIGFLIGSLASIPIAHAMC